MNQHFFSWKGNQKLQEYFISWKGNKKDDWIFNSRKLNHTDHLPSSSKHSWWRLPICINLMTNQFLPEHHGNVRQSLGIRIEEWKPNTQASLNFYRFHSKSTIKQVGGEMEREKFNFVYMIYCSTITLVFSVSLRFKNTGVFFSSILRSRKCGFVYTCFHASTLSPTTVFMWWRKMGKFNFFYCVPPLIHKIHIKKFLRLRLICVVAVFLAAVFIAAVRCRISCQMRYMKLLTSTQKHQKVPSVNLFWALWDKKMSKFPDIPSMYIFFFTRIFQQHQWVPDFQLLF